MFFTTDYTDLLIEEFFRESSSKNLNLLSLPLQISQSAESAVKKSIQ
ncbi:MAG: hypothetical protein HC767_02085 [Akkermansiaceae bacterium]|nr:hypothetical protein [Akkermansiaceae bacterium]